MSAFEFLKPSNKEKKLYENIITLLSLPFPKGKTEIKEMLFKTDVRSVEKYLHFEKKYFGVNTENAFSMLCEVLENGEPYRIPDLEIGGRSLIKLGICGEKAGVTLEYLRKCVAADPTLNRREILLQKAEEFNRN